MDLTENNEQWTIWTMELLANEESNGMEVTE